MSSPTSPTAADLADEIGGLFVHTDVADDAQVRALAQSALERFDRVDVLVNNAGIALGTGDVASQTDDEYRRQFEVNVMGVVHGLRHFAPVLTDGGSIVNMASMAGVIGAAGSSSYGASKWSVIGITKTSAIELAPRRIRVNAICPSGVSTAMYDSDDVPELVAFIETMQPLPRAATPDEIAAAVHFLAADDCAYITGHALHIDGGLSAGPSLAAIELAIERHGQNVHAARPRLTKTRPRYS